MTKIVVCALYKFVRLDNYEELKDPLLKVLQNNDIRGTLLLASEGINGTVAGSQDSIEILLNWLQQDPRLADIVHKESYDSEMPFYRTKVKLKKEIVTMGVEGIDPNQVVGTYVKPTEWNALIDDPDVLLVDTRNDYEVQIGTFKDAVNPNTTSFREFPEYVKNNMSPKQHKKVAMFCTGGIRCEKSTAYLKEQGYEEVYHLEGGILKYLEEVPEKESLWQGDCFVFDNRVSVNHDLEKGQYDQCHACRMPITEADKLNDKYQKGVSCHHCIENQTEQQRSRFLERQRQVQFAEKRGEDHIGSGVVDAVEKHKAEKERKRRQSQH